MEKEEIYKIADNNFADIIVDEIRLREVLKNYKEVSVNRINSQYSTAYLPANDITSQIIDTLGYESIPKCYGLMSVPGCESFHAAQLSNAPVDDLNGKGVLVGFVDTGIDYMNLAFQNANRLTRIVSIWDQTIASDNNAPAGFYYGTEYSKEQINNALRENDPLSVVPSRDENGHGTILAGIAGGSYNAENGFIGVATDVEYVVVKLKQAKSYLMDFFNLPKDTICYQDNDIMFGINYLIQVAKKLKRPIAICIGIGTSQGAHVGEGIFNNYLNSLGLYGDVAIVVASGNEGNSAHHYYGEIVPSIGFRDVELNIGGQDSGLFIEFWGTAPNVFSVEIYAPEDELVGRIPSIFKQESAIKFTYKNTTILVNNTLQDSIAGDQFILMRIQKPQIGTWRFRVTVIGDLLSNFHLWLPTNNFISAGTFFKNANPYTTITAPGNEETVLTVTAYDSLDQVIYYYASRGFTKERNPKPDVAAPGVNVLAPTIHNQYTWMTGTSVAAAYATGAVAILLEWGIINGNFVSITSAKLRSLVTGGARRVPYVIYPNPFWGFGILDIYSSMEISKL